tara:strand:+ start:6070 stop:6261 length:192 start_codon:yes stop_codon:yes gene_type:complete
MKSSSSSAETSIEFAIDNALERLFVLEGSDHKALIEEYKEWLSLNKDDIEVLFLDHNGLAERF